MRAAETRAPASHGEQAAARQRLKHRTENAFAEEERDGLILAAKTRTAALGIIAVWQALENPNTGLAYAYELAELVAFAVLGLLQYASARWRFHMDSLKYFFVMLDCVLLAVVLTIGNPFTSNPEPPAFAMHGSPFTFFFLFLMQSAFTLRPRLVLWCGLWIALARTGMLIWVLNQPETFTDLDLTLRTNEAVVAAVADPNFVFLGYWTVEVMVSLLVAAGLAVVVVRSRRLVNSRSTSERARANLARYFSPNVVDRLSGSADPLGAIGQQDVAVLFVDIQGFTRLCERESPERVIAILRDYHNRLGQAVFANDGTLDKYLGDGLMATFGTPDPTPQDAANALKCALDMIAALDAWNAERRVAGAKPIRIGIGLHYGKVIAGDIGNERRLEHSVIGDTVNIASRLEELTRSLETRLVVSDSLVKAVDQSRRENRELLHRLTDAGTQEIRGRESGVPVWTLKEAA